MTLWWHRSIICWRSLGRKWVSSRKDLRNCRSWSSFKRLTDSTISVSLPNLLKTISRKSNWLFPSMNFDYYRGMWSQVWSALFSNSSSKMSPISKPVSFPQLFQLQIFEGWISLSWSTGCGVTQSILSRIIHAKTLQFWATLQDLYRQFVINWSSFIEQSNQIS